MSDIEKVVGTIFVILIEILVYPITLALFSISVMVAILFLFVVDPYISENIWKNLRKTSSSASVPTEAVIERQ